MPLPDHEFFKRPTRISRVYPVLALVLMLAGSGFLYRWQLTEINADSTVQRQNKELAALQLQVDTLTRQQETDQADLKDKTARLTDATAKLQTTSDALASKERALIDSEARLKSQEAQIASNSSELDQLRKRPPLFSFRNESNLADIEQKEKDVKEFITNAYDYIQEISGTPYLLNQITITFVNQFTIAGAAGEISIENGPNGISIDIHLKDFDKNDFQDQNTMVHEIVHGFGGTAELTEPAMAEGRTVALTDAVMERMIADGKMQKFDSLYIILNQTQYNQWNNSLNIPLDNDAFYASKDISKIYQVIGKAWFNLYREDSNFFKKLNDAYYSKVQKGETPNRAMILPLIKSIIPSVGGVPIDTYLSNNQAFNPR